LPFEKSRLQFFDSRLATAFFESNIQVR